MTVVGWILWGVIAFMLVGVGLVLGHTGERNGAIAGVIIGYIDCYFHPDWYALVL